jgi:nitric oxide reductase subunit B
LSTDSPTGDAALWPALRPTDARTVTRWGLLAALALAIAVISGTVGTLAYASHHVWLTERGITLQHLRPIHTSFATAWVFLGGIAVCYVYALSQRPPASAAWRWGERLHWWCWIGAGAAIVVTTAAGWFSGREYLGFHPACSIPILVGWGVFIALWIRATGFRFRGQPVYVYMWNVALLLFVYTFVEAHLFLFDGIGLNPVRDTALQWKAYGALVGSFNLLVYGAVLWVAERISGDRGYAQSNMAFGLFYVGLVNSFTNFAHHTYHLPQSHWVKWISFVVSMAEMIILAKVLWDVLKLPGGWNRTPATRFVNVCFGAATVWTLLQLVVSLLISIPPLNALLHGTHVVTAHAMGSMLGIDSMILWGAVAWVLAAGGGRAASLLRGRWPIVAICWTNIALLAFWGGLLVNGTAQAVRRYGGASAPATYSDRFPWVFGWAGAAAALGILVLLVCWTAASWRAAAGRPAQPDPEAA